MTKEKREDHVTELTDEQLQEVSAGTPIFEISDFSFDIEQTLNIGSQSTGAGASKVTIPK